jgi:hypothetical protein
VLPLLYVVVQTLPPVHFKIWTDIIPTSVGHIWMKQYCFILMDCSKFLFFRILYHTLHSLMLLFTHACIHTYSLTHSLTLAHALTYTQYRYVHSHVYSMYKHPRVKYSIYIACYVITHSGRTVVCSSCTKFVCWLHCLENSMYVPLPFLCYTNMQWVWGWRHLLNYTCHLRM